MSQSETPQKPDLFWTIGMLGVSMEFSESDLILDHWQTRILQNHWFSLIFIGYCKGLLISRGPVLDLFWTTQMLSSSMFLLWNRSRNGPETVPMLGSGPINKLVTGWQIRLDAFFQWFLIIWKHWFGDPWGWEVVTLGILPERSGTIPSVTKWLRLESCQNVLTRFQA